MQRTTIFMGRKSLAEERREDILAAFERCIARYGIDVPLEQIADEAGVKRSLIRHYLGNRDELVEQVIERIAVEYPRQVASFIIAYRERGLADLLDAFLSRIRQRQPGIGGSMRCGTRHAGVTRQPNSAWPRGWRRSWP
ncbi:TetR/AcrR family transcriptional regulator [Candidatus Gracilibacteria bacterium]|nr:TetR/AcrR family transcriptional regulator [Candidatus Gracilibacteria bacterium]